jgi:hypothetical protein
MFRTRTLLSAVFGTLLLVVMAGPAQAGPAPLDDGSSSGGGTTPAPIGSGTSLWTYVGYAMAALLVVAVIAATAKIVARHAGHQAPHPV